MSTELFTWIMLWVNASQFYYFLCAFLKAKIKNYYLGAAIYAIYTLVLRYFSNYFEGFAYDFSVIILAIFQIGITYVMFDIKKWYHPWVLELVLVNGNFFIMVPVIKMAEFITGTNVLSEGNNSNFDVNYVISSALMCMVFMVCVFLAYAVVFLKKYRASKRIIPATFGVVIYQILVISLFYMICKDNIKAVYAGALFVAFSILSDMAILKAVEHNLESRRIAKEYEQMLSIRTKELSFYEKFRNLMDDERMRRHEYANYIQVAKHLLDDEKTYEEGIEIIEKIRNDRE